MLKKPYVIEKNKFCNRIQHPQIYQNQLVLSLSFFVFHSVIKEKKTGKTLPTLQDKIGSSTVTVTWRVRLICFGMC